MTSGRENWASLICLKSLKKLIKLRYNVHEKEYTEPQTAFVRINYWNMVMAVDVSRSCWWWLILCHCHVAVDHWRPSLKFHASFLATSSLATSCWQGLLGPGCSKRKQKGGSLPRGPIKLWDSHVSDKNPSTQAIAWRLPRHIFQKAEIGSGAIVNPDTQLWASQMASLHLCAKRPDL